MIHHKRLQLINQFLAHHQRLPPSLSPLPLSPFMTILPIGPYTFFGNPSPAKPMLEPFVSSIKSHCDPVKLILPWVLSCNNHNPSPPLPLASQIISQRDLFAVSRHLSLLDHLPALLIKPLPIHENLTLLLLNPSAQRIIVNRTDQCPPPLLPFFNIRDTGTSLHLPFNLPAQITFIKAGAPSLSFLPNQLSTNVSTPIVTPSFVQTTQQIRSASDLPPPSIHLLDSHSSEAPSPQSTRFFTPAKFPKHFTVATANIHTLTETKSLFIMHFVKNFNISFFTLQECGNNPATTRLQNLLPHFFFFQNHKILTIISKKICVIANDHPHHRISSFKLFISSPLTVTAYYGYPREESKKKIHFYNLLKSLNSSLLIGDSNATANPDDRDSKLTYPRDISFRSFIRQSALIDTAILFKTPNEKTFSSPSSKTSSRIDHIFITYHLAKSAIQRQLLPSHFLQSDHNPIILTLSSRSKKSCSSPFLSKDHPAYPDLIKTLSRTILPQLSLQNIASAAERHSKDSRIAHPNGDKPWKLIAPIHRRIESLKNSNFSPKDLPWVSSTDLQVSNLLLFLNKPTDFLPHDFFSFLITTLKSSAFLEFVNSIYSIASLHELKSRIFYLFSRTHTRGSFSYFSSLFFKESIISFSVLQKSNSPISFYSPQQSLSLLFTHFRNLFSHSCPSQLQPFCYNCLPRWTLESFSEHHFENNEVRNAISHLSPHKASTHLSHSFYIDLTKICPIFLNILTKELNFTLSSLRSGSPLPSFLFQQVHFAELIPVLKRGKFEKTLSNIRPITLISTFRKVFSALLTQRLFPAAEFLSPKTQFANRKRLNLTDAIFFVNHRIARAIASGSPAYFCFLDIQKAFDSLNYSTLKHLLTSMNINQYDINLILNLIQQTHLRIKTSEGTSPSFIASRGVSQGDPASGLIFQFFSNSIIFALSQDSSTLCIGFVDDILTEDNSASSFQSTLNKLPNITNQLSLTISSEKSFALVLNDDSTPNFLLQHSHLQIPPTIKHLGVIYDNKGSIRPTYEMIRSTFIAKSQSVRFDRFFNIKSLSDTISTFILSSCTHLLHIVDLSPLKSHSMQSPLMTKIFRKLKAPIDTHHSYAYLSPRFSGLGLPSLAVHSALVATNTILRILNHEEKFLSDAAESHHFPQTNWLQSTFHIRIVKTSTGIFQPINILTNSLISSSQIKSHIINSYDKYLLFHHLKDNPLLHIAETDWSYTSAFTLLRDSSIFSLWKLRHGFSIRNSPNSFLDKNAHFFPCPFCRQTLNYNHVIAECPNTDETRLKFPFPAFPYGIKLSLVYDLNLSQTSHLSSSDPLSFVMGFFGTVLLTDALKLKRLHILPDEFKTYQCQVLHRSLSILVAFNEKTAKM